MKNLEKPDLSNKRKSVAEQIKQARKVEKGYSFEYHVNRHGFDYLRRFLGLRASLEYVKTLSIKRVLDIGTGTGVGIAEISKLDYAQNIDFETTALVQAPSLKENLPEHKVHLTSAEVLRGIKQESIAMILALNSVAYSVSPELCVKRINEVLVPGGVVKATFASEDDDSYNDMILKRSGEFVIELRKSGFDVSPIIQVQDPFTLEIVYEMVLAIKPGNPSAPSAKELLEKDEESQKL